MTADFVFNTQVKQIRKKYKVCGQFHDEVIVPTKDIEKLKLFLKQCIDETNRVLKLNVPLDIDMNFGLNYAEIH